MNHIELREEQTNNARLIGRVCELPKVSHKIEDENFAEFKIEVERLSKTKDIIPVTISQRLLPSQNLKIGDCVSLIGEYRSYNKFLEEKSKLILHMFAKEIEINDHEVDHINEVKLIGYICKEPIYRKTPLAREICDVLIAVNRVNNMKSDYIPCIFWGRNARFVSSNSVGTKVELTGRIQSRTYIKTLSDDKIEEKTAYELSCQRVGILSNLPKLEVDKECAKDIG